MSREELKGELRSLKRYGAVQLFADNGVDIIAKDLILLESALALVEQAYEQKKPTLPDFVAEWLVWARKNKWHLSGATDLENTDYFERDTEYTGLTEWMRNRENLLLFVRAWDNGCKIQKKHYRVLDKAGHLLLVKDKEGDIVYAPNRLTRLSDTKELTEAEIKGYDERFWAFREEVTS